MTPILSIVAGTFNRLDYLRAMIQSVRDQMVVGIGYEFVIVDGGSTDGTQAWCKEQSDVRLIEHGELRGAIKAFCDGANAAQGDYVILANDDILFTADSILKALVHLTETPTCGAVAFMDDRKAPGYEADGYHVQTIRAINPQGKPVDVVYAQVGMYRRWLGNLCGWWDMGDTQQHTYGGDAYLSAAIWERGYTVDAVAGAACQDRVAVDDLRKRNANVEQSIGSAYYRKYPNGVRIGSAPRPDSPQPVALRILYCPLFSPGYGRYKSGLCDALSHVALVYELDYEAKSASFIKAVENFQPHVILSQFHDGLSMRPNVAAYARSLVPGVVWVNWNGDVYADNLTSPEMLALLEHIDLQTTVNADVLPFYAEHDVKAAYWQIGFEPVPEELPEAQSHDVLFMANAYSPARKELASVLKEMNANVGIYGYGWGTLGSGNTFYDFRTGAALYRKCKVAIGDNQYADKGFVSNRLFESLANGAFLLHQAIPGLDELTGLREGVHYVAWTDYVDLKDKINYYLTNEAERQLIAIAGELEVRERHSFDARVKELFEGLLPSIDETPNFADENVIGWADGIPR